MSIHVLPKALYIALRADRVFTLPVICSANESILVYTEYVTENTWCCVKYKHAWKLNSVLVL